MSLARVDSRKESGLRGESGFPGRFSNAHVPQDNAAEAVQTAVEAEPTALDDRESLVSHYSPSLAPNNGESDDGKKSLEASDSGHTSSSSRSSSSSSSDDSQTVRRLNC